MKLYQLLIRPHTAFATPLKGDTLFGQLCWLLRRNFGESRLLELLEGYTDQRPFAVISDPLPSGYLRRPCVPLDCLGLRANDPRQRKDIKAKRWLPESVLEKPVTLWGEALMSDGELVAAMNLTGPLTSSVTRQHNSLNRMTGSTGAGEAGFAPFARDLTWHHPEVGLRLYASLDENRLTAEDLGALIKQLGQEGYGKEATSGCGKFELLECNRYEQPRATRPDTWLTLAPSAPQGQQWDEAQCYYEVFTRFGRHGDIAVHSGNPFKNPILMAQSFAVLKPATFLPEQVVTGQGLVGLSKAIDSTVQQGYSPVLAVQLGATA